MTVTALVEPVPRSWKVMTLGDACALGGGDIQTGRFGSQLHASDYVAEGIPSIMPQNIGDNKVVEDGIARIRPEDARRLSRYVVRAGDIVYSRRGDVERRALIRRHEEGWLCGTGCLRVRFGTEGVSPSYASYYLGHPAVRGWIVRHAHGATMPNLNTSILAALPFLVPPAPVQCAIAHVLGALDDKIELNRRMNETLEAMARAIFKSWFVDFDPVRAKAAGRRPAGVDAETAALFPARWQQSEHGKVPAGWSFQRFSDIVGVLSGGTPKTSVPEYWGGRIPWFSVVDAPRPADVYVVDTERKVTEAGIENSAAEVLPLDTTIITARGTVGKCALVGAPMAMNQSCYGLRARGSVGPLFVYFATREMVAVLQQRAHGSVFDTITRDTFADVSVVVPPSGLASCFVRRLAPQLGRIKANLHESRTLAALRDALLPKLLSGELRLPDAGRIVEAAV